jgi:hypothetical protein
MPLLQTSASIAMLPWSSSCFTLSAIATMLLTSSSQASSRAQSTHGLLSTLCAGWRMYPSSVTVLRRSCWVPWTQIIVNNIIRDFIFMVIYGHIPQNGHKTGSLYNEF